MSAIEKIKFLFTDYSMRQKVFFVLIAFVIFRFLASIPVPGVNRGVLASFFESNDFLGLLNIFSGGGLNSISIVMLGVFPYITASIIMQLSTIIFPKLKETQREEGEIGRKKISNYSRILSVPLAFIQAFGFLKLLQFNQVIGAEISSFEFLTNVIIITAGSVLVMWIGELITEFGIGNGISLLIFGGIVASLPGFVSRAYDSFLINPAEGPVILAIAFMALLVTFAIVFIEKSYRAVPITNARASRSGSQVASYMPIKLNQAGVIPIIFAISILIFPTMIISMLQSINFGTNLGFLNSLNNFLQNPLYYGILYFILVFFFTYFYTSVVFDPKKNADNLQKGGSFVPGVRPGEDTEEFFENVSSRITFLGATFLGLVAVLPLLIQSLSGVSYLTIGGSSLLIVVSVGINLIKTIDSKISMRQY